MKATLLALSLTLAASAATAPAASPPLCRVTATYRPVPGLDSPFIGAPFRYLFVTAGTHCAPARIALSNYGGREQGEPLTIQPGEVLRLGPVPLYRRLSWLAESGVAYDVPIRPARGAL